MAKQKTPLLSLGAEGTIGDVLTHHPWKTHHIVTEKPIPAQPRTLAQMYWRWLYQDYAAWWNQLPDVTKWYWHQQGVPNKNTAIGAWLKDRLNNLTDIAGIWHLDRIIANKTPDASKNTNTASVLGPSLVDGRISKCMLFDGIDDHILMPLDASLTPLEKDMWIEGWVNTTSPTWQAVYYQEGNGHFNLRVAANGTVRFHLSDDILTYYIDSVTTVNDGHWHHLSGVWVFGIDIRLYIDGVEEDVPPTGNPPQTSLNLLSDIAIGRRPYFTSWFKGLIDEVVLRNRVPDISEIKLHSERRYPL